VGEPPNEEKLILTPLSPLLDCSDKFCDVRISTRSEILWLGDDNMAEDAYDYSHGSCDWLVRYSLRELGIGMGMPAMTTMAMETVMKLKRYHSQVEFGCAMSTS